MKPQDSLENKLNRALQLREQGSLDAALKLFLEFSSASPSSTVHLVPIAEIFLDKGAPDIALAYLVDHRKKKPQSWISSVGLYHCLLELNRPREAVEEALNFKNIYEQNKALYSESATQQIIAYLEDARELADSLA